MDVYMMSHELILDVYMMSTLTSKVTSPVTLAFHISDENGYEKAFKPCHLDHLDQLAKFTLKHLLPCLFLSSPMSRTGLRWC